MQERFLKNREVMEIVGLSRSTIDRMVKAGEFPQPVKIRTRNKRWKLSDINRWMDSKTSQSPYVLSFNPVQVGRQNRIRIRVWRRSILMLAGYVVGPLLHQVSTTLEQVRSRVGLFGRVSEGVGQRRLRDDPGHIRLLQGPVLEAAAEPVDGGPFRQTKGTEDLR